MSLIQPLPASSAAPVHGLLRSQVMSLAARWSGRDPRVLDQQATSPRGIITNTTRQREAPPGPWEAIKPPPFVAGGAGRCSPLNEAAN